MPARSALAWSAVSRSSATGTTQVISMRLGVEAGLDQRERGGADEDRAGPVGGLGRRALDQRWPGRRGIVGPEVRSRVYRPDDPRDHQPHRRPHVQAGADPQAQPGRGGGGHRGLHRVPPARTVPPDGRCPATMWL